MVRIAIEKMEQGMVVAWRVLARERATGAFRDGESAVGYSFVLLTTSSEARGASVVIDVAETARGEETA